MPAGPAGISSRRPTRPRRGCGSTWPPSTWRLSPARNGSTSPISPPPGGPSTPADGSTATRCGHCAALERIWPALGGRPGSDFEVWAAERGDTLRAFAVWSALAEVHPGPWWSWPAEVRHPRSSPARLVVATLDDAAGVSERPNMPGTIDEWPNWRIALPAPLDDILDSPLAQALVEVFDRARGHRPVAHQAA